ncbi:exported membrane protein [Legionella beliardensis]|uniref:Exported membrane protein n=1 Tax=Legionella beliardensis TaxID=91822 RepID=A0A378JT42_9GAMM|nr:exported membrane protein [Legionella beliardensis]
MTRHTGLKVLTGVVVLLVLVVLSNGKPTSPKPEATESVNNVNQAIASQFNDNIRDVSARLLEDEKKD